MQTGYGYGWGVYRQEPLQMWDMTFQPRGYQGHGGTYWGYSAAMFMVEEEDGAYGIVLMTNTGHVGEHDVPWDIAIKIYMQDLILGEAQRMYQESLKTS